MPKTRRFPATLLPEDAYRQALDFLYRRNEFAVKLGLQNITRFFEEVGLSPELPAVHVAGTNGKGTVCYCLGEWLPQLGYKKVGVYTSPHLVSFRERIRVNGVMVPREWVGRWVMERRERLEALQMTYFECVTALAVSYFTECGCDAMVLETGLGGRLDATNWCRPLLCVLTEVSLDHQSILGDDMGAIFSEKLGILKPDVPAVVGPLPDYLEPLLQKKSKLLSCPLLRPGLSVGSTGPHPADGREGISEDMPPVADWKNGEEPSPSLLKNVRLSWEVLKYLAQTRRQPLPRTLTLPVSPCRQQVVRAGVRDDLILDVAHNPAGVSSLVEFLKTHYPGTSFRLLFSVIGDKDVPGMLSALKGLPATESYFIPLTEVSRAISWEAFQNMDPGGDWRKLDLGEASLNSICGSKTGSPLVVFGSFYLLGALLPLLAAYYSELDPYAALAAEEKGMAAKL